MKPGKRFAFGCVFLICITAISIVSMYLKIIVPPEMISLFKWVAVSYIGGQSVTDMIQKEKA